MAPGFLSPRRPAARCFLRVLGMFACMTFSGLSPDIAWAVDPNLSVYQYNCRTWRRANGLPSNAVNAIAQSADGHLWLGTSKGLVHFDGVEFRTVGLPRNQDLGVRIVTTLARRTEGGLWVGLERGGVGYFAGEMYVPVEAPGLLEGISTARVVKEVRDGGLLIGVAGAFGKKDGSGGVDVLAPDTDVLSLCEEANGRLWLGTANRGLLYLDDGELKTFTEPGYETWEDRVISSVEVDRDGLLWVGASNGLHAFNPDFSARPDTGLTNQPRAMLLDSHGVLWVGTLSEGLVRYKDGRFSVLREQDGLASNRILSLAESDDGSIWVGTEDGLSQLADVKFPILSVADGLSEEVCLGVAASPDGGIWAGTANGLSHYRDGTFTNYGHNRANGFYTRWIKRVFAAKNGDVYMIGGRQNLSRFVGDNVVKTWTPGAWPRAIAEDSQGILVAVQEDLMRIEDDELIPWLLADGGKVAVGWINELLVARDGSIWVAGEHGIAQIKDGVLSNWAEIGNLDDRNFSYICEDDGNGIWAATGTGLVRVKDGKVSRVNRQQGLYEDFVYAIVPDFVGGLWMDSNQGIFRVDQAELNAVADGTIASLRCIVYEGQHAVKTTDKVGQEYSGCRSSDGRIWFPSLKGVIVIDPANVPFNPRPPPTHIQRVLVNGREIPLDGDPGLKPGPGNLQFDYFALDYQAPEKIRYRYRLEGYEDNWVEAEGRRSAFYTNLPPGSYHFQVQASSGDNVRNTIGAGISIDLPHRLYETLWFRLGMAVALLAIIAYVWFVRERLRHRAVEMNVLLEQRVKERTAELEASNRELESFSYSVSHDLRAPLRGIDGWSHLLMRDCGDALDEKARGHLAHVRSECQRMGALIDGLLQLSRTARAEMSSSSVDLSEIARECARRVEAGNSDRWVEFVCPEGLRAEGDQRLLESALFNLIDNAWKFSGRVRNPRVEFGRAQTDRGPAFFVRDNGAGFKEEYSGKLFGVFQRLHNQNEFPGTGIGLATVHRVIERHGGKIWAESRPGVETTFYFTLGRG